MISFCDKMRYTYIRVALDLRKGFLVELAGVRVELVDVERLLHAGDADADVDVATAQAALVHVTNPVNVRLDIARADAALQLDNIFTRHCLLCGRRGKDGCGL